MNRSTIPRFWALVIPEGPGNWAAGHRLLHLHESCGHRLHADREANNVAVGFKYEGRAIAVTGIVAGMVSKDPGAASAGLTTEGSADGVRRHFAEERALEYAKCQEGGRVKVRSAKEGKGPASLTTPSGLGARWSAITAVLRRPAGQRWLQLQPCNGRRAMLQGRPLPLAAKRLHTPCHQCPQRLPQLGATTQTGANGGSPRLRCPCANAAARGDGDDGESRRKLRHTRLPQAYSAWDPGFLVPVTHRRRRSCVNGGEKMGHWSGAKMYH